MKPEQARLKRLQRLEKVRAIARQTAAAEAARAESTRAQLEALAERTRLLAQDYAGNGQAMDGFALRQWRGFSGGLQQVHATTTGDAARARDAADGKLAELGRAERRRAAVEERVDRQAKLVAKGSERPVLVARKGFGTNLE